MRLLSNLVAWSSQGSRLTIAVLLVLSLIPTVALANHNPTVHQLEWWNDSVNNGSLIYHNKSKYGSAVTHADNTWSALGKVNVAPAPNTLTYDLRWEDYTNSTDGLCGFESNSTASYIKLNTVYMDPADDWHEKSCAAHELGHGLGIGDHGTGYESNALMYGHVGRFKDPMQHDKNDYFARWQ